MSAATSVFCAVEWSVVINRSQQTTTGVRVAVSAETVPQASFSP